MSYLILGVALLVGLMILGRWFVTAQPSQLLTTIKWTAIVLSLLVGAFFLFTGRLAWAVAPLGLIVAAMAREFARLMARRAVAGGAGGFGAGGFGASRRRAGGSSDVETQYLRMVLDHDSGEMDGEVIAGRFQGRSLGAMSFEELVALLRECADGDEQSTRVLESYLDRREGADWRERAAQQTGVAGGAGFGPGRMRRDEAWEILGLQPGAADDEIREAHRRLMSKIHPDHGGSDYLAAKINEAKEVLLAG